MKILPLIVLLACVAWTSARPQEDGEPRPAVSRGLLKRGLGKGKQTTTTTTQAPQDEAEYDEGDYPAEESQEPSTEAPPSSTEGKKLIGVRPFRSNTDLLEILKRKRAQAAEAKLHGGQSSSAAAAASSQDIVTEAPAKSSYSKKRFNNQPARESNNEEAPAASKPSRNRFGRPSSRSVVEPEPEEQNEAAAPLSRGGRAFSRRGSN